MYWYRKIHSTSWVLYLDNRAVWEETNGPALMLWCRARGIVAEYRPLTIAKFC